MQASQQLVAQSCSGKMRTVSSHDISFSWLPAAAAAGVAAGLHVNYKDDGSILSVLLMLLTFAVASPVGNLAVHLHVDRCNFIELLVT
mmetsp:Transcript_106031/g.210738  ORF Transcript_106031/g.210738 Transcript_106031/m.210738 type:complete len:88 (-) Transcript_106031:18-281(-)